MTNKEAIAVLKKDRDLCLFNPMTGEKEPMNEDCRQSADAYSVAIEALEKPEIIRCKDCKYLGGYSCLLVEGLARQTSESYCSLGERKEKTDGNS